MEFSDKLGSMTLQKLLHIFEVNQVPGNYYVVDGVGGGECYGIGIIDQKWTVYYSERGKRNVLHQFESEEAACLELLRYVSKMMLDDFGRTIDLTLP